MSKLEKCPVSLEDAIAMLPDADTVHTFLNPAIGVLIGADWDKREVVEAFRKAADTIEKTGPQALAMGHGLAFRRGNDHVFVETRP